jgi:hypothetical protein
MAGPEDQRVAAEVKQLENMAKSSIPTFAAQLHNMPTAERAAIGKQIQADARSDHSLPPLTFTDSGDLKSADVVQPSKTKTHFEFSNGKLASMIATTPDGSTSTETFDPATGKIKSMDTKGPKGNMHIDFDANGMPIRH